MVLDCHRAVYSRTLASLGHHHGMYVVEDLPKLPLWRQLLMVAMAIAMALTIFLSLLAPPGGAKLELRPPAPDAARCGDGERVNCLGGTAQVIVVAPAAVAPAAPAAVSASASAGAGAGAGVGAVKP